MFLSNLTYLNPLETRVMIGEKRMDMKTFYSELELPEELKTEMILLYNLGVGISELKYILSRRLNSNND